QPQFASCPAQQNGLGDRRKEKSEISEERHGSHGSMASVRNLTSVVRPLGAKVTTMPAFRKPVSTRPTGTM
ncbi:hypothetical protein M91_17997, partial [Bos mutus]